MIRVSIFGSIYTVNFYKKMVVIMKHTMDTSLTEYVQKYDSYRVLTRDNRFFAINNKAKVYCSIQIIKCEKSMLPFEIAESYFHWLSKTSKSIIKTVFENKTYKLYFCFLKKPLLTLTMIENNEKKTTFAVSGGILAKRYQKGRFTFKRAKENNTKYVIALEEFESSLPWLLYRITQAPIHEIVMEKFQKEKGITD